MDQDKEHEVVIRMVDNDIKISCRCQVIVGQPGFGDYRGGRRDTYHWFGVSKSWPETVRLFNQGDHNGSFGEKDHLGRRKTWN